MSDKYLIGVDIGTQGTKTVIFSKEGKCVAKSIVKSKLIRTSNSIEENPEDQFDSVCRSIGECMRKAGLHPSSIAGIGIDGQMAGIVGIGSDGKHITPYDSWLDNRCSPYIKLMEEKACDEILRKTGNAPSINHGPKILWWKHEKTKIFSQIESFVQPGAYVAMRLCGLKAKDAFIDNTYLHFSGFANNKQNTWDYKLCDYFDIDCSLLPRIVKSSEVIGEISSASAKLAGLSAGIPVVAGCGDTAASFLSAGAVDEGICVDVAGTASVFAATTFSFKPDTKNKTLSCGKSVVGDLWHPYAYINGGGMNLEWFKTKVLTNKDKLDVIDFEELNRLASEHAPDIDDPVFIPHLGGRSCPGNADMRGAWFNLSWSVDAPILYRSILESVAMEYCLFKNSLSSLYDNYPFKELRITGGGEKSVLWNQMKADALGIKVVQIQQNEGAPMGAAMLAGLGTGFLSDIEKTINEWVKTTRECYPDPDKNSFYEKRMKKYNEFLELLS